MIPNSVMNLIANNAPKLVALAIIGFIYWRFPWLIPLVWVAVFGMYYYEKSIKGSATRSFRRNRPFSHYGIFGAEQQLLFTKASEFETEVLDSVKHTALKYPGSECSIIDITDQQAPNKPYNKSFLKVEYTTRYNTKITTLFQANVLSTNLCLQWWILACGEVTTLKLARFILTSPLTIPFWIIGWFTQNYSIHTAVAADIDSSYDVFDISVWVEAFVRDIFLDMIATLKELGVDVSSFEKLPPLLQNFNFQNSTGVAISVGSNNQVTGASGQIAMAPRVVTTTSDTATTESPAHEPVPAAAATPTPVPMALPTGATAQVMNGDDHEHIG